MMKAYSMNLMTSYVSHQMETQTVSLDASRAAIGCQQHLTYVIQGDHKAIAARQTKESLDYCQPTWDM